MKKESKYISSDGVEYDNYQDYCNSNDLDPDIVGVMLSLGRRTPQNEYETRLLAEIQKLQSEGKAIEFPFN